MTNELTCRPDRMLQLDTPHLPASANTCNRTDLGNNPLHGDTSLICTESNRSTFCLILG